MAEAVYENPLIPNARLRQIYRGMIRARTLARALRGGSQTLGLEACLVGSGADLGPGDLVSDSLTGGVVEFLRGANLRLVLRAGKTSKRGASADRGAAARLPAAPGTGERIWTALGAAAALQAEAARARADAKTSGAAAHPAAVVLIYAQAGEAKTALWRTALTFAAKHELPAVFVVLPAPGRRVKPGTVGALALSCGVPGIAVDAEDAVAIYRVAQESIGRARAGGGPALIDCVPFVIQGAPGKRESSVDAIAGLERYMMHRGVCTQAWLDHEAKSFASRAAKEKAASKLKA